MPPASAVNNNSNNAAVQAAAKAEREEKLRGALKNFILRERQRKKEEYEAQCEEIRLKKEREARERQNDMTLEETRGQIVKMEEMLIDLSNRKQELFLQLKKVLNEDETRKKQQKDNEMYALHQQASATQIFVPTGRHQHQLPPLPKSAPGQGVKRGRTPSPPLHQGTYKEHDEARNADYARILWNKHPNQYQSTGTLFYQTTSCAPQQDNRLPYSYNMPHRQSYSLESPSNGNSATQIKTDSTTQKTGTQLYHINFDQPGSSKIENAILTSVGVSMPASKTQVKVDKLSERYQIEPPTGHIPPPHLLTDNVMYKSIVSDPSMHTSILQTNNTATQVTKATGSITQGYAGGRITPQEQQQQQQQQQQQRLTSMSGSQQQPTQYSRRIF